MCLLHIFIKMQATATLNSRIALKSESLHRHQREGTLKTLHEVVYYLLASDANDDAIPEIHADIVRFTQPLNDSDIVHRIILGQRATLRSSVQ